MPTHLSPPHLPALRYRRQAGIAKGSDPSITSSTLDGSGTGVPPNPPVRNIVGGALIHDEASTKAAGSVDVLVAILSKLGNGLSKIVLSLKKTFKFAFGFGPGGSWKKMFV